MIAGIIWLGYYLEGHFYALERMKEMLIIGALLCFAFVELKYVVSELMICRISIKVVVAIAWGMFCLVIGFSLFSEFLQRNFSILSNSVWF